MENPNVNCLEGMKCLKCGSYGPFEIRVSCLALITDDGAEDTEDFDWDRTSYCSCTKCGKDGTVQDFIEPDESEESTIKDH